MKILQEALNSAIESIPQSLLADLLGEKLTAQGVRLSRRQCEKLARQAINEKLDSLNLPWWRFWQYRRFRRPKQLLIEFTPEDTQKITTTLEELSNIRLPELIQQIIAEQPERILAALQSVGGQNSRNNFAMSGDSADAFKPVGVYRLRNFESC
jgi:hypothetical protein